ncbi:hypothetical protein DQM11_07860 [Leuconostoc pseudomesenteroides]|nr:hypothetical protein DQM11_08175 [Leuconostoc pseudomesenteroides]RDG17992.1 hypothetical protein DQM11_07860 [Leuconostoc pseudomesenteroides]
MDLVAGLVARERQYGYMSDEAISWFRKEMSKSTYNDGNVEYDSTGRRLPAIEQLPKGVQADIVEMYQLGYTQTEVANYFDLSTRKLSTFYNKMFKNGVLVKNTAKERFQMHEELIRQEDRGRFNSAKLTIAHGRRKA